MAIQLKKGQKISLTKESPGLAKVLAGVGWDIAAQPGVEFDIDLTAFLTGASGKVEDDSNIIFYNNAANLNQSVVYSGDNRSGAGEGDDESIMVDLPQIPPDIHKIVFTLTIFEADARGQNFGMINNAYIRLIDQNKGLEILRYDLGNEFSRENAIIVGELYRYNEEWRFSAVGSGFFGGLNALCKNFGLDVEEDQANPADSGQAGAAIAAAGAAGMALGAVAAAAMDGSTAPISTVQAPGQQPASAPVLPAKISLLKQKVDTVLAEKQVGNVRARVGMCMDISGSMRSLYKKGEVQKVVDRILAVASRFDDDGILDMWIFSDKFYRLPAATIHNYENYIERNVLDKNLRYQIFGINNEPSVMQDIIQKYTAEESSPYPAFLVFISDGGINSVNSKKIQDLLIQSSGQPIFWQFVGIGSANYAVLQKLDDLQGRILDNADFFEIPNIEKITDESLYSQLLNEFPGWLKAAAQAGVIRL